MKILKKILLVLSLLILVLVIISLFLPSNLRIERSVLIGAGSSQVYNYVNDLKQWKKWSYWDQLDSAMISVYEGTEQGAGSKHVWQSENPHLGNGSLTITESVPDHLVVTVLNVEGMGEHTGGWMFRDSAGGTWTTTYMDLKLDFHQRLMGKMMDKWLGGDFEKALEGLKNLAEKSTGTNDQKYSITKGVSSPQIIASIKAVTSMDKITGDIDRSFQSILNFMGEKKLNITGPVMAYYHSFSRERIEMECAIPVDQIIKGSDIIIVREIPAVTYVKADYYGDYLGSGAAHEAIDKWIAENKKTVTGSPWEVYVTDPTIEKDTAKWLTEVYYPIEE